MEDRSVVLALQSIQETVDIGPRDAVAMACLIAYRRGSLLRTSRLVVSEFVAHDLLPDQELESRLDRQVQPGQPNEGWIGPL